MRSAASSRRRTTLARAARSGATAQPLAAPDRARKRSTRTVRTAPRRRGSPPSSGGGPSRSALGAPGSRPCASSRARSRAAMQPPPGGPQVDPAVPGCNRHLPAGTILRLILLSPRAAATSSPTARSRAPAPTIDRDPARSEEVDDSEHGAGEWGEQHQQGNPRGRGRRSLVGHHGTSNRKWRAHPLRANPRARRANQARAGRRRGSRRRRRRAAAARRDALRPTRRA